MVHAYYVAGTDLKAGSFNSRYKKFLSNGTTPPPPADTFADALIDPGFTVTYVRTTNVSGGGAALQTAINAALPFTRLLITDSLTYDGVTIAGATDLTIEAATGQTPTINAPAGPGGHCVTFGNGNDGVQFIGIGFAGIGNATATVQNNGLICGTATSTGMATFSRLIVNRCTFSEQILASGTVAIVMIGTDGSVHRSISIVHCTMTDNGANTVAGLGNLGCITICGFDTGVFIQNTKITRMSVARGVSGMKGVVVNNLTTTVQDVLVHDPGNAGTGEAFWTTATFGTVVAPTSTFSNCVAYNCKRNFRSTAPAGNITVSHSVCYVDVANIWLTQTIMLRNGAAAFAVDSCAIVNVVVAVQGTAFSATITENNNCVFGVASNGKVLDATDLTIDPVISDVSNNDYRTTQVPASTNGLPPGTPMGLYYPGGTVIFWAGVP